MTADEQPKQPMSLDEMRAKLASLPPVHPVHHVTSSVTTTHGRCACGVDVPYDGMAEHIARAEAMSADEYTPSEEAVERAARAIDTLGWWCRAWWPAEYHGDTRNQTEREDAYRNGLRAQARAALVAAGPPDLARHDRETAATAWDEGFTRGFYDVLAGGTRDASESSAVNPYERGED